MSQDLHILTGAPGTGKTAVLSQLTSDICRIDEPAREILADHRARFGQQAREISTERFVDLILEPWDEIYTADEERKMTFSQIQSFHQRLEEAYRIAGYTRPGPHGTLEQPSDFVEKFVWRA